MKSFSNETLNFFLRKFLFSYILDFDKTKWALRILPQLFTKKLCNRRALSTGAHSLKLLAYLFHVRLGIATSNVMNEFYNGGFLPEMADGRWHMQKFWALYSSAQSSFIIKSPVNICHKIRRTHKTLARSKMWEKQNFLKKKLSISLEKDFIFCFHTYFSASFAFYFFVSNELPTFTKEN